MVSSISDEICSLGRDLVLACKSYYDTEDETFVSADRMTTVIQVTMTGDFDEAAKNVRVSWRLLIGSTRLVVSEC